MQHHPNLHRLVEAELDEVVAGPERPQMGEAIGLFQLRILGGDAGEALGEARPGLDDRRRRVAPGAGIALAAPDLSAMRHGALDRGTDPPQPVRQVARHQRGARRHHPAADIDPDRGRDHGTLGRDDRADGGTDADMDIGHGRDMAEHEGHLRRPR